MKMKTVLFALVGAFFFATTTPTFAITAAMNGETPMTTWTTNSTNSDVKTLSPEMLQMSLNKFLTLTPSKYKEMTGKKLGLRKSISLKFAQKLMKSKLAGNEDKLSKGVYILLAILGWGFLSMGLLDDWKGKNWTTCLILSLLCGIPGIIYAFVKMKDYY
jgi:hypothetical protein